MALGVEEENHLYPLRAVRTASKEFLNISGVSRLVVKCTQTVSKNYILAAIKNKVQPYSFPAHTYNSSNKKF